MNRPTKKQIAKALGISPSAFTRYIKRGCPTWSVDAARAWRDQHVDPSQRLAREACRTSAAPSVQTSVLPDPAAAVARVQELFLLAAVDFDGYAERLRQAMRTVPVYARRRVQVDSDVLSRLLPAAIEEFCGDPDAAAQTDDELDELGDVLYGLACDELELQVDAQQPGGGPQH